jgi:hypothetical protein
MGMFDEIRCEYPLQDPAHNKLSFQTKDLENVLDNYTITKEGRLLREAYDAEWVEEDPAVVAKKKAEGRLCFGGHIKRSNIRMEDQNYHGYITFYDNIKGKDGAEDEWVEYKAKFTDGTLVEVIRHYPEWVKQCKAAAKKTE